MKISAKNKLLEMFSEKQLNLLKVIKENKLVSKKIFRHEKIGKAFLRCLELYNWDEKFFLNNLKDFAEYAEKDLENYIYNFQRDSFLDPYREIVQEFYEFSEEEITALSEKWVESHSL